MSRTAGRDDKIASGIVVYLMEELGDARLRAAQLKQYVAKALELVEKSEKRDHFFEVAADLIHGIPDVLFKLDKALDAAAMAAARMDYEEIKQGLKPEKAEELERVLDDVRLHYLKRRSSQMNAKEAARTLELFAKVTEAKGSVPTADLARFIARLEGNAKMASGKNPVGYFREAAEYLRTTEHPSRNDLVASLRRVLADALIADEGVEAGAGEDFKKVNPNISDEAVEKIDEMHEKNKDVVKDKSAADDEDLDFSGFGAGSAALDAFNQAASDAKRAAMSASSGHDRSAAVHGLNTMQSMTKAISLVSPKYADKLLAVSAKVAQLSTAIKQDAAKSDVLQKQAAYGDPYWMTAKYPGKDQDGKPFKKGDKVFYYPRTKTILTGDKAEKAAREFGAMAADEDMYGYRAAAVTADEPADEGLEDACWKGYVAEGLKPGKGGEMVPNCVPVKTASEPVAEDWKAARFEKGKPADPTENMSEEDAAEWKAMTEEHGDQFKTAKLQARQIKLLQQYIKDHPNRFISWFDDLPSEFKQELRKVKDQETLDSDVDRWLQDNNRTASAVSKARWKA